MASAGMIFCLFCKNARYHGIHFAWALKSALVNTKLFFFFTPDNLKVYSVNFAHFCPYEQLCKSWNPISSIPYKHNYSTVRVHLLCPGATTVDPSALGWNCVRLGSIFGMNFVACVRSGKTGQNKAKPGIFACTRA